MELGVGCPHRRINRRRCRVSGPLIGRCVRILRSPCRCTFFTSCPGCLRPRPLHPSRSSATGASRRGWRAAGPSQGFQELPNKGSITHGSAARGFAHCRDVRWWGAAAPAARGAPAHQVTTLVACPHASGSASASAIARSSTIARHRCPRRWCVTILSATRRGERWAHEDAQGCTPSTAGHVPKQRPRSGD